MGLGATAKCRVTLALGPTARRSHAASGFRSWLPPPLRTGAGTGSRVSWCSRRDALGRSDLRAPRTSRRGHVSPACDRALVSTRTGEAEGHRARLPRTVLCQRSTVSEKRPNFGTGEDVAGRRGTTAKGPPGAAPTPQAPASTGTRGDERPECGEAGATPVTGRGRAARYANECGSEKSLAATWERARDERASQEEGAARPGRGVRPLGALPARLRSWTRARQGRVTRTRAPEHVRRTPAGASPARPAPRTRENGWARGGRRATRGARATWPRGHGARRGSRGGPWGAGRAPRGAWPRRAARERLFCDRDDAWAFLSVRPCEDEAAAPRSSPPRPPRAHLSAVVAARQHEAVPPVVQVQPLVRERLAPLPAEDAQAGTEQTAGAASLRPRPVAPVAPVRLPLLPAGPAGPGRGLGRLDGARGPC